MYGELSRHLDQLIDIEYVDYALRSLEARYPKVVEATLIRFSLVDIVGVLQGLLCEGLSIKELPTILNRLLAYEPVGEPGLHDADDASRTADTPASLLAWVRVGLAEYLSHKYARPDWQLTVLRIDSSIERLFSSNKAPLDEATRDRILDLAWAYVGTRLDDLLRTPILVQSTRTRAALREVLAPELPDLAVMAEAEVCPHVRLVSVATLGAPSPV
jgi:flagellar biosynthesis component FlhA